MIFALDSATTPVDQLKRTQGMLMLSTNCSCLAAVTRSHSLNFINPAIWSFCGSHSLATIRCSADIDRSLYVKYVTNRHVRHPRQLKLLQITETLYAKHASLITSLNKFNSQGSIAKQRGKTCRKQFKRNLINAVCARSGRQCLPDYVNQVSCRLSIMRATSLAESWNKRDRGTR